MGQLRLCGPAKTVGELDGFSPRLGLAPLPNQLVHIPMPNGTSIYRRITFQGYSHPPAPVATICPSCRDTPLGTHLPPEGPMALNCSPTQWEGQSTWNENSRLWTWVRFI